MTDALQPENLRKVNRLDALDDAALQTVVRAGRHVHLPAGWSLIAEQTPADKAYLILEGEVSVRQRGVEVARLGAGEVIGEAAIVSHTLRTASVVSLTPLEVLHFTRESLEDLLDAVPAFGEALRSTTADRLGD